MSLSEGDGVDSRAQEEETAFAGVVGNSGYQGPLEMTSVEFKVRPTGNR